MRFPDQIRQAIESHARWVYPNEACGLIAVDADGDMRMAYCLTNIEDDSSRFTVDPVEHFHAQSHAERCGWQIGGSFHSHPHSVAFPSGQDVAAALDPTWVYVIAGPVTDAIPVRGFRIRAGAVSEIEFEVSVML